MSGKKFPSSIEALLRRALKGGPPVYINPLVDLYNAVSLAHTVPAGGFDLTDLDDRQELRFPREGDTFQALDEDSPVPVPPSQPFELSHHPIPVDDVIRSTRGSLYASTVKQNH